MPIFVKNLNFIDKMSNQKDRNEFIRRIHRNLKIKNLKYDALKIPNNGKDFSCEIEKMYYTIYVATGMILVDGNYFIDMKDVVQTGCTLDAVTYYKKVRKEEQKEISCSTIQEIRTFYVKDYFLITQNEKNGSTKHFITDFLYNIGAINAGRNQFIGLYSNKNAYKVMQSFKEGYFPKDLYHPIKRKINGLFFDDDYRINDFKVISPKIRIK